MEEALEMTWPRYNRLRCFLGIKCKKGNFRSMGVGSKLMDELLVQASQQAVSEIWGSVTADDIKATPHLLKFYQDRGFTGGD